MPSRSRTAPLRILLIEDNEDTAQTLCEFLELEGHSVHVEYSGVRAVEVVKSFRPDVVVCDIGLPERDGFMVAVDIRSALGASAPRMIALSGYGTSSDRERSQDAGFVLHLTKPVAPEDLSRSLAAV